MAPRQPRARRCAGEQRQVVGVDLGDQQRHERIHPVAARVADHDVARRGERRLDVLAPRWRRARRTSSCGPRPGVQASHAHARGCSSGIGVASRQVAASPYALPSDRSLAASQTGLNHGWFGQLADELLPHHAGGAENADVDTLRFHDVFRD